MADELREYTVQLPLGESTILLSEAEAEERGLKPAVRKAKRASNKSAAPEDKAAPAKKTTAQKRADVVSKSFGRKGDA